MIDHIKVSATKAIKVRAVQRTVADNGFFIEQTTAHGFTRFPRARKDAAIVPPQNHPGGATMLLAHAATPLSAATA